MIDSPLLIGSLVFAILPIALVLMIIFNITDRLFLGVKLLFVLFAGAAIWGALGNHAYAEYAVWMMYLSGLAMIGFMVYRIFRKSFIAALIAETELEARKLP